MPVNNPQYITAVSVTSTPSSAGQLTRRTDPLVLRPPQLCSQPLSSQHMASPSPWVTQTHSGPTSLTQVSLMLQSHVLMSSSLPGTLPPESCIFGQFLNIGAFLLSILFYIKYKQVNLSNMCEVLPFNVDII